MADQQGNADGFGLVVAHVVEFLDRFNSGSSCVGTSHNALPIILQGAMACFESTLRAREATARDLLRNDTLTGALTRVAFRRELAALLATRTPHSDGFLLLIDVDRFRHANQMMGHLGGDRLLALIAGRLDCVMAVAPGLDRDRPAMSMGRVGGNEFAIFVSRGLREEAIRCSEAIRAALRQPFFLGDHGITISATIGIALCSDNIGTHETLLASADVALQQAKASHRGSLAFAEPLSAATSLQRASLAADLHTAILDGQFLLQYQPQLNLRGNDGLVSAEALLRWHHPVHGIVPPIDFLPFAEEIGLMCDIGRWVIAESLQAIARWREQGLHCRIAVNLSPSELVRCDLVGYIREWLVRTAVPAAMLEIEVTESVTLDSDMAAITTLTALRRLGVTIAIDDFGTGYSNLARLTQLPVDRLKIDKSLSARVANGSGPCEIAACIIKLGKALGHEIVIEGIEDDGQVKIFTAMGCDLLQGFAISRPLHERDLPAFFTSLAGRAFSAAA